MEDQKKTRNLDDIKNRIITTNHNNNSNNNNSSSRQDTDDQPILTDMKVEEQDEHHKAREDLLRKQYFSVFSKNRDQFLRQSIFSPKKLEFLEEIGEGSFSKVILVKDLITLRTYALKFCAKKRLESLKVPDPLESEYRILKYCKKIPGIPGAYHYCQDENFVYLLEEYVKGQELLSFILKEKKCLEFEIFSIFICGLKILKDIHKAGIIHHDIKCENIIINHDSISNCYICFIDFGLSELKQGTNFDCNATSGSPDYMAPEKRILAHLPEAKQTPYNGKLSDLYALGVVLFCLMYKRFPYSKKDYKLKFTNRKTRNEHVYISDKERGQYSQEAENFVSLMIHWNKNTRLTFETLEKHTWFFQNEFEYSKKSI